MLDRKPPAKRSSELSEDTTTTGEGDAAAVGLLALKSFPSNGSISSSALLSRRPTTGAAASATAASARKGEPEDGDEEGIQDAHQTQQHDLRHTSIDSRYECPCCQHEFFTTQTSWEEIQLHVTSCVDLNESIDSAKIMASALVTMKSSPEIPDDLHRASRKRKLAPKAAAAAAAATEAAAFADNRVEGKKRAPKRVAANAKAVKSSRIYSTRKKKPPRPSKRRDRGGSIAAAASEKRRRAQDVASLSSGPMQQTLSEMVMGYLDMLY
jgi:hypothetical protein